MPSLLHRLKERKLFQWTVAYLAGAWLVFQGIEVLAEPWNLSEAVQRTIHVLLGIGFLVTLVLAWYHGEKGRQRASGVELLILAGILVIAGAAAALLGRGGEEGQEPVPEPLETAAAVADRASVAVLPFENLSPDADDAYFADGVHDEIISQLSKIAALKVTSRTSVMQYRGEARNVRKIARELRVRNVVEGTVRRAGDRVRITAQLIDAEADEHLWAESYERELHDIFAIQSDVAQQIAAALRATLTLAEIERIEARPTENLQAYDLYLRGRSRERREAGPWPFHEAVAYYEQAVELDPEFVDAWSRLAIALFELAGRYGEVEARPRGKEALDRASYLAPDAVQTRIAQGYYYYRGYRWDQAVLHFSAAERLQPSNAEIPLLLGFVIRGQGRWEEGLQKIRRAAELDPLNAEALAQLGVSLGLMGQVAQARPHLERAASVDPLHLGVLTSRLRHYLLLEGDTARARAVLEEAVSKRALSEESSRHFEFERAWFDRDYPRVVVLEPRTGRGSQGRLRFAGGDPWLRWAVARELAGLSPLAPTYLDSLEARVETEFASFRARIERLAASDSTFESGAEPSNLVHSRWHADLAVIRALQGRAEDAIREGKRAVDRCDIAFWRPGFVEELAAVYVRLGRQDEAIEQLEYVLTVPSYFTVASLRIDPTWDPLRDHPRFQALLEQNG
jgi:TolB-like protein/Flp pilus assembly protein TadD